MKKPVLMLAIAALLPLSCSPHATQPVKSTPDVVQTTPIALSDTGQIVGSLRAAVDALPAFVDTEGKRRELSLPTEATWALPNSLNARGQIVGFTNRRDDQTRHAAVWNDNKPLPLNDAGARSSEARILNNRGDIAGFRRAADGSFHTCLWRNGALEEIEPLSRVHCFPTGLNAQGEMVGWGLNTQNQTRTDLGRGYHVALNNRGQIAGDCEAPDHRFHACLWDGTGRHLLPNLPGTNASHALALNDRGQIAGRASGAAVTNTASGPADANATSDEGNPHAMLWEGNHVLDLNTLLPPNSVCVLEEAIAINEAGQILCTARQGIWSRGALLTPIGNHWNIRFL